MRYLEENMQFITKIFIKKVQKKEKKSLKFEFLRDSYRFKKKSLEGVLTPYLGDLHTKFGINRIFRLGVTLYTDRQTDSQTLCFIFIKYSFFYFIANEININNF